MNTGHVLFQYLSVKIQRRDIALPVRLGALVRSGYLIEVVSVEQAAHELG
jgi:hypothetical protein